MKFSDMKASELTDIIAVVALSIGLALCIITEQKDLGLMIGGALGGVVGMASKGKRDL